MQQSQATAEPEH